MRKLLALLAACFFVVSLASCSTTPPEDLKAKTLLGTWVSTNQDLDMVANVTRGNIDISMNSGGVSALYWRGTFLVPTPISDNMLIPSVADKAALESSLLGSGADTKDFQYKNGQLSYDFTIAGITQTVYLERR